MPAFRSVTTRLIVWILSCSAIVYVAVLLVDTRLTTRLVDDLALSRADAVAASVGSALETLLREVESATGTLATALENTPPGLDEVDGLLKAFVADNPTIFGAAVALEPGAVATISRPLARYFHRDGPSIVPKDLATEAYAYRDHPWYTVARDAREPSWSEPYLDRGGGEVEMVTHSVPLFLISDGERSFVGVVTSDVALSSLRARLAAIERQRGEGGRIYVLSRDGQFVSRPKQHKDDRMLAESALEVARRVGSPELEETVKRMIAGDQGTANFIDPETGESVRIYYAPVPATGWSVAVAHDRGPLLLAVALVGTIEVVVAVIGLLLLAVVIVVLARRITRPLRQLARTTERVARGELDFALPTSNARDEVDSLARAFLGMRDELKRYIENLRETTAAKQRLESELEIARQIQMSMLPVVRSGSAQRQPYDIAASLIPARAVGGDLYDVFPLSESRLFFSVGDVSDKGVPAALFMAKTLALAKLIAGNASHPSQILSRLNERLCEDNEACMFVTLFCAILDIDANHLIYASAGHEPPLQLDENGYGKYLQVSPASPLGLREDARYTDCSLDLLPGHTVFVYTDGVTEATNGDDELYGEARLEQAVTGKHFDTPDQLIEDVLESVQRFVGSTPQSDDITVLALRYMTVPRDLARPPSAMLRLDSNLGELPRLHEWIAKNLRENHVKGEVIGELQLVAEEILSNVIHHAYASRPDDVLDLSLAFDDGGVVLECRDFGPPFNPLGVSEPDLERPVGHRPIGGLGIHLMKKLAVRVEYRRRDEQNVLTVFMSSTKRSSTSSTC